MKKYEGKGQHIEVPLGEMFIDHPFQSDYLDAAWVRRLAADWDQSRLREFVLSYREPKRYAILDGQHRYSALQLLKAPASSLQPSEVFYNLTRREESEIAASLNRDVKRWSRLRLFQASVAAGAPLQVQITNTIETHGFKAGKGGVGVFRSIAAAESVVNRFGIDRLEEVFDICVGAWGPNPAGVESAMVKGVARLVAQHPGLNGKLSGRLAQESPSRLLIEGRTLQASLRLPADAAMAEVLKGVYNHGRKEAHRLP